MAQPIRPSIEHRLISLPNIFPFSITRIWMGFILFISDIVSLMIAGSLALLLWSQVRKDLILKSYVDIIIFVFVFALIYGIAKLYPAIGVSPVEELRLLSISTTVVFLWLGTLTFYMHNFERYSRASFGLAWIFAIIFVPTSRHFFRTVFASLGLWGEPIALIGYGEHGSHLLNILSNNPKLGYRPTVLINGFSAKKIPSIPIPQYFDDGQIPFSKIGDLNGIRTAIIITSEIPQELLTKIIEGYWHKFQHLILISDDQKSSSVWIEPHDIAGILGLEVRQNLFSDLDQAIKRVIDICLVLIALPILIILFLFLAVLIRIDTPGPIFYSQKRVGKDGEVFTIWKFRTMVVNAEQVLKEHLQNHATLQTEWQNNQKIKNDPRVTAIGKILRRFSLDELPQFINIFHGEMSLVGPRPIVQEEITLYGDNFHIYTKVKPGLTGLWQVSGRNDLTYHQRVNLDEYYVRNWSIWMDIYIIATTIGAALTGKGAY
jgi:Undecaprenyl-phosphate galactose phosphotransferase WbaP